MTQTALFADSERRYLPWAEVRDYQPPTTFPRLREARWASIDLETFDPGLAAKRGPAARSGGYIVGAAVKTDTGVREYYPMRHSGGPNCDAAQVENWLRDELSQFRGEIIGANVSLYDGDYLQVAGIRAPRAKWRDVQWAEALIDENANSYALEVLGQKYLGRGKKTQELKAIYGEDVMSHFREVHPAHAREYGLVDVDLPPEILVHQRKELARQHLTDLYDLECRLVPLLLYMRQRGVRVDLDAAERMRGRLLQLFAETNGQIKNVLGFEIDVNSGPDVARAFDKLGLAYPLTEKGAPSFRKPWLKLQADPLSKLIVSARQYDKLRSTFIEGYILNGNINRRIHCQFHPLRSAGDEEGDSGTITGRFSSTNPNLQNIPIRTALGKEIRAIFRPENGRDWWCYDLSQIEYRFLTHFACKAEAPGAEAARQMYLNDSKTDFHQAVAILTGLERGDAKNLNFGLVYGMGVPKLAATLGLTNSDGSPTEKALEIMATYHERAPFIKAMYNMASKAAQSRGYVRTILGRRGHFDLWEPKFGGLRQPAYPKQQALAVYGDGIRRAETHKALNKVVQGSSADQLKRAMVNCWEAGLFTDNGPLSLGITLHDELDGDVDPGAKGQESLAEVKRLMEGAIPLLVPVFADGHTGKNWAEAKG